MEFTKLHSAGNDYIYFNCQQLTIENPTARSIRLTAFGNREQTLAAMERIKNIWPSKTN